MSDGGLAAGAVARLLGVSVTTLRTWHQRYGLGPSLHRPGHHRRYSPEDLGRLQTMVHLTGRGVPAAEAAQAAMSPVSATDAGTARAGGGPVIPVGRAGPAARGLARAAMRMDAVTMLAVITTSLRERGVVDTWDGMLAPVLIGVGERHAMTQQLVEVEHLLSRSISEALATVPRPVPTGKTRILLACVDEEQHSLALEALAAALAERGGASRLLGARVPGPALAEAVRRTGPAGVVVWSQVPATASSDQIDDLLVARPRPIMVAAAGPGWSGVDLPDHVRRPASLVEALELTAPLAGP